VRGRTTYEECRPDSGFPSTAHRFSPLSPKDLSCSRVRNGHPPLIQDSIVEGIIKVVPVSVPSILRPPLADLQEENHESRQESAEYLQVRSGVPKK
jgi:hypothetical protein